MANLSEKNALVLAKMLSSDFYLSPLKFALWAYPWGQGDLKEFKGPRKWQREIMLEMEKYLRQGLQQKVITDTFPDFFRAAVASGRGPGKSAFLGMIAHWFMSTRIGGSVWVAANGEPQLRTKTFPEIAKWVARGINSEFFEVTSTAVLPSKWFKEYIESPQGLGKSTRYYYIAGQLWSQENPDAFAGAHNHDGELALFDEACHDDKTDVLTRRGWVRWSDVTMDDEFLTMDPVTHVTDYEKPLRLHVYDHDGPMCSYVVKGADFCVTPNHQMYYTTKKLNGVYKKRPISEMKSDNCYFKRTLNWEAADVMTHRIPALHTGRKEFDEKQIDMDTWLEFLGWYVSEGHIGFQNKIPNDVGISNHDPVVIERVEHLARLMGYEPHTYDYNGGLRQVHIYNRQLADHLVQSGVGSLNIRVPEYVRTLSKRQIRIYLDAHREGDGYLKKKSEVIYTSSMKLADDLQELYLKVGMRCRLSKRALEGKCNWIINHWATSSTDGYVVSASAPTAMKFRENHLKTEHYKGKVYCAEVPNHLLYTRRNGQTLWSGNSGVPDPIWTVQEGVFTENIVDRYWIAFSNPRRNEGAFYECFHKDKKRWRTWQIDSRTVEGISTTAFENIIDKYGEDSDEAKIEVYGQFPSVGDNQFISPRVIDEALSREHVSEPGAKVIIGVDVARFGNDRTIVVVRKGRAILKWYRYQGLDTMGVCGKVIEAMREWKPDMTIVDEGGLGAGVLDRLVEQGYRVRGVQFGSRADNPVAYFNKRSEMWGRLREWLMTASIGSLDDNPTRDNKELKADLSAPRYKISSNGSVQLESKQDMKKRGLPSTDMGDAAAITLAYPLGDNILLSDQMRLWSSDKTTPSLIHVVQSYTGAYTEKTANRVSACSTWGVFEYGGKCCVLLMDCWSEKMTYPEMREKIIKDWHATYGGCKTDMSVKSRKPDAALVAASAGESMIGDLRTANIIVPRISTIDDLIEAAHQVAPILATGVVYVPESGSRVKQSVTWARDLLEQFDRFPNDEAIELVDTFVRAMLYLRDSKLLELNVADPDEEEWEKDYHKSKEYANPYAA